MKRLLRSIIDFGGVTQENLVRNFQKLNSTRLEWIQPPDQKIFDYVRSYFQQQLELPSGQTVQDYFAALGSPESGGDIETLERLKDVAVAAVYIRTNYVQLLSNLLEEQSKIKAVGLLKETNEIIVRGLDVQNGKEKVRRQGVREGLIHFAERSHDLIMPESNVQTGGDIRLDGEVVWKQYETAKTDKSQAWGKFTGINEIDKVCHGIKKGELWIHAAAPGELKSSLALNWCYNLVTRYRANVLYYSMEMPYEQIRLQAYVIHSANAKWKQQGYQPLDYRKVRDGELEPPEEVFYQKVIEDFCNNPDYCQFEIRSPDHDVSIDDIRLEAELLHKQMEVGLIVLDHGQLIEARKSKKSRDYVIELNSVVRDAKKLALHFNHGEKVPVLMLFQINRQGKEEAVKNEGRYKMNALAYSNECLTGNTLVKAVRGLLPLDQIVVGDQVWSTTGYKNVSATFDQGVRPTLQIDTDHGLRITPTRQHLLRVLDDSTIIWMRADQLTPGTHYLLGDFGKRGFPSDYPTLPPLVFRKYEKPQGEQQTPVTTPSHMTEDLAYLMGAYEGDGVAGNAYCLGFTGNRLELHVKHAIKQRFQQVFGHPIGEVGSPSRPGSFDLRKWSKALKRWFVDVGMNRQPGVPRVIMQSPRSAVIQYLRGFWDTGGCVNSQYVLALGQKLANRTTLSDVQLLMSDLGIETTLVEGSQKLKGQTYKNVVLKVRTHTGQQLFHDLIGFTEPYKMQRLKVGLQRPCSDRDVWPVGKLYLEVFDAYTRGKSKVQVGKWTFPISCLKVAKQIRSGRKVVPEASLRRLLETLVGVADPRIDLLRTLLETTRPHLVTQVVSTGDQHVYDIEVGGDHEYSTGGLLSHNCERSADTITTTFLDDDHRRNGTTLFCCLKNRDNPLFEPFLARIEFGSHRIYNLNIGDAPIGKGMGVEQHQSLLDAMALV